ncbi:MAG: PDDEXK nuclease domain-containing protein [Gammaproteobacteria bacterium]|nr:PDDEXK nuclease domain-containing protein [Gammaproteobacteria bacterium]
MPADYATLLGEIKQRIRTERVRVVLAANQAMVLLYWDIGKAILARQEREGWGAGTIDRLSHDLREAFPDMRGFSPRNLKYMRAFAAAWPEREIVQQAAAQIPWSHNCVLLDKVPDRRTRVWYVIKTQQEGWSRSVLTIQIENRLHERQGGAVTNFPRTLPQSDSDLATQAFKDPYLFDFLGTAEPRTERELEQGLVDHIQRFLLEMGAGFAFVGRPNRTSDQADVGSARVHSGGSVTSCAAPSRVDSARLGRDVDDLRFVPQVALLTTTVKLLVLGVIE